MPAKHSWKQSWAPAQPWTLKSVCFYWERDLGPDLFTLSASMERPCLVSMLVVLAFLLQSRQVTGVPSPRHIHENLQQALCSEDCSEAQLLPKRSSTHSFLLHNLTVMSQESLFLDLLTYMPSLEGRLCLKAWLLAQPVLTDHLTLSLTVIKNKDVLSKSVRCFQKELRCLK